MAIVIDTSVAIAFRDGDEQVFRRVEQQQQSCLLPMLAVVELENGVASARVDQAKRRVALDLMLQSFDVLPFDRRDLDAYREIVEQLGYSRPLIIDRMIAAQALVVGLPLATLNPRDFHNIPRLKVENWLG